MHHFWCAIPSTWPIEQSRLAGGRLAGEKRPVHWGGGDRTGLRNVAMLPPGMFKEASCCFPLACPLPAPLFLNRPVCVGVLGRAPDSCLENSLSAVVLLPSPQPSPQSIHHRLLPGWMPLSGRVRLWPAPHVPPPRVG